jgi:hypothetical protein
MSHCHCVKPDDHSLITDHYVFSAALDEATDLDEAWVSAWVAESALP